MLRTRDNYKFLYELFLFSILFTETEGFGLRGSGEGIWAGLGNSGLGLYGMIQFVLLIANVYILITSITSTFNKSPLSRSVKAFMLLFVVIIIQGFFQSLFSFGKVSIFVNLTRLTSWLLVFTMPVFYKRISFKGIANVIMLAGLISAVICILVITMKIDGTAIRMKVSDDATRALRVMLPSSALITLSLFMGLSYYQEERKLIYMIVFVVCFGASFIQLHRSSTAALIITTAAFMLLELRNKSASAIRIIIIGIVGAIALGVLFNATGYSFDALFSMFTESKERIQTGDDSGTSMRFNMIYNALSYVIENYIILGIGLDWEPITDPDLYNYLQFAKTPTNDNGYYNIIIVFGFLGLIIFIFMLINLLKSSFKLRKGRYLQDFTLMSRTLFYFFVYTMLVSMGGDRFFFEGMFPLSIGMMLTCEKYKHQYAL